MLQPPPPPLPPSLIVARYIREQYPSALPVFLAEAGLGEHDLDADIPDLRTILQDHYTSQLALSLAKTSLASTAIEDSSSSSNANARELMKRKLAEPVPLQEVVRKYAGVSVGNLLGVGVERLPKRWFDTTTASYKTSHNPYILVTSVDKSLKSLDIRTGEVDLFLQPHRAAILSFAVHPKERRYLLTGSMDGSAVITDLITNEPVQTFKQDKFVVKVAFSPDGKWLATASYDKSIAIYNRVESTTSLPSVDSLDEEDDPYLAKDPDLRYALKHKIEGLSGNPESLAFHPTSSHLLYTTRASHLLHYLSLTDFSHSEKSFNPHRHDTHVSFCVLNMAIHPEGGLLACQTGDHAGHAGERVLIYDVDAPREEAEEGGDGLGEERLQTIWTGGAGDDFVMPRMAWLPDGSGIITTTTTGQLTLLDLSGKVRSRLKAHGGMLNGTQASEIVRDVAVTKLTGENGEEETLVVSVGYDGQVCISK